MMHIIRGSGISGLAGMDFRRGAVIRPLLNIYRSEIEEYCKAAALSPRTDSSNLKADFSRNKVRLELFPYINRSFGTDITESLCRLSASAAEDNDYLEQCARTAYKSCLQDGKQTGFRVGAALDLRQLGALHPAVLFRVLRMAVSDAAGNCTGIGKTHYQALCRLVQSGRTGMRAELPGGIRGEISYNRLLIFQAVPDGDAAAPESGAAPFEMCLEIPGKTTIPELDAFIDAAVEQPGSVDKYGRLGYNSFVQFFDYDCIKRGMNIRNRRDGDVFKPFGSTGTKKLKEYFIDQKIPRGLRNDIPLVCVNHEVVWVVGYKISDKFKVTENTKSVLRMEYSRRII
jgi:tRNA(Ile)-lysidine synthase